MSETEEPKRPTEEHLKRILNLRKRMERKEFYREILEQFPKSTFHDYVKLSCGHWTTTTTFSIPNKTSLCFRCIEAAEAEGTEE